MAYMQILVLNNYDAISGKVPMLMNVGVVVSDTELSYNILQQLTQPVTVPYLTFHSYILCTGS